jgi:pilus assembly protein CpaB
MGRRTVILLIAIILAALGALMVWLYVRSVQAEVSAEEQPTAVLVAQVPIASGTTGQAAQDAGAFTTIEVPAYAVAEGALTDPSSILTQVALVPIATGEQVLASKFGSPGDLEQFTIPRGKIAASFQLSDPARVAGFVKPSSEVAVFVTLTQPEDEASAPAPAPLGTPVTPGQQFTRAVLPRIEVLATGQTTVKSITTTTPEGEEQTEQIPQAILTLALTQEEAQKLIFAQSQGELYFGLLDDDSRTSVGPPTWINNVFAE